MYARQPWAAGSLRRPHSTHVNSHAVSAITTTPPESAGAGAMERRATGAPRPHAADRCARRRLALRPRLVDAVSCAPLVHCRGRPSRGRRRLETHQVEAAHERAHVTRLLREPLELVIQL